jgi:tetratricopeptide (TPR) repeat protein
MTRILLVFTIGFAALLSGCGDNAQEAPKKSKTQVDIAPKPNAVAEFKHGEHGFEYFVKKNMVIPKLARFYGVNGTADVEVTVDTAGNVISVRGLRESMDFSGGLDTSLMDFERNLMGQFALEAERLLWMTSGYWQPALTDSTPRVSSQVLSFEFNTRQFEENLRASQAGNLPQYGKYDTLQADPTAVNFYKTGTMLLTKGYYTDAVKFLTASTRANGIMADAWFNLGLARTKLKQNAQACDAFTRAAKLGDEEAKELAKDLCEQPPA